MIFQYKSGLSCSEGKMSMLKDHWRRGFGITINACHRIPAEKAYTKAAKPLTFIGQFPTG